MKLLRQLVLSRLVNSNLLDLACYLYFGTQINVYKYGRGVVCLEYIWVTLLQKIPHLDSVTAKIPIKLNVYTEHVVMA